MLPDLALGVEAVVVRLIIGTMVGTQIRNKDNGIETDLIKIQDQMRIKEQGSTQISGVQSSAQHGPRALFRFQGLCFLSLFQRAVRCSLLAYLAVSSTKSCSVVKNFYQYELITIWTLLPTVESVKDEFVRSLRTIIALPAANRCESVAQGGAGHAFFEGLMT